MVHLQEGSVSSLLDFPTYSQQPPAKRLHVTETVSDATSLLTGMMSIYVRHTALMEKLCSDLRKPKRMPSVL